VARAFSDPPMNLIQGELSETGVRLPGGLTLPLSVPPGASRGVTLGIRAGALRERPSDGALALPGTVELAEISGSDTFVHVATAVGELVSQLPGVHEFGLGTSLSLHMHPSSVYLFDQAGELLLAPAAGRAPR
jgi:glycerol transport system ATP-binding protein